MARKQRTPTPEDEDEQFEVEKIISHKMHFDENDRIQYTYRIRWKGYHPDEDTWEPTSSLEGGAGSVLEQYQRKKEAKGEMFYPEGTKKSTLKSLKRDYGRNSILDGASTNGKPNSSSSRSRKAEPEEEEDEDEQEEQQRQAEEEARAERKRKKRESQAQAAAEEAQAQAEEEERQRSSQQHISKKSKRVLSESPLPELPVSRRDKENEAVVNGTKKPVSSSSRRSAEEVPSSKRKSTTVTQSDEEDAFEIEQIKRSPLKEKKADQPVVTDSAAAPSSHRSSSQTSKKASADEEEKQIPHVKPAISGSAAESVPTKSSTTTTTTSSTETANEKERRAAAVAEEEQQEEEVIYGSTIHRKAATWEDLITVDSLEQTNNTDYRWMVTWADDIGQEWIPNNVARRKFPQRLLDFYQEHLKFKTTVDGDDEEDGEGVLNGDDAPMAEN